MNRKLIPDRLVSIRNSLGISKAEAARRLDLSKVGYGRYESGQRTPSPQTIEFIAQRLGTTAEYLTGSNNDPSPDYCIVSKEDEDLFALVTKLRSSDPNTIKRLLLYYENLQDNNRRR